MNTDLTAEQIESYQENGFIKIENFLNADELEKMRDAVTESVDSMGNSVLNSRSDKDETFREESVDDEKSYYSQVFLQRLNLWRINDFIKDFFICEQMGKFLCELEGVDGMRVWHDQTLQKKPWGNPTAFHLDNPYWSFSSRHAISIWVALDDATMDNGCLWYL
ncbi:MAG: phytanoyl-CoA dioxygenase family protein, partial [Lentisphaeria bacterium]|nr:phytanoyl-CoA dioxygenase family protein [Lentisphaeria bacterium]